MLGRANIQFLKESLFDTIKNNISHEIREIATRMFEKAALLGVFQE